MKKSNLRSGVLNINYELSSFLIGFSTVYTQSFLTDEYKNWLGENEYDYYNTLKFEKRKLDFLRGRIAAKNAIAEIIEKVSPTLININAGVFKFPVVKGVSNIQISITHAENFAVSIAFPDEHPIGIDLEKVDNAKMDVMKNVNLYDEIRLTDKANLAGPVGHTLLWTVKESLSKILRTGLTINFGLLQVATLNANDGYFLSTFSNFHQYKAISYVINDYVFTVALPILSKVNLDPLINHLKETSLSN